MTFFACLHGGATATAPCTPTTAIDQPTSLNPQPAPLFVSGANAGNATISGLDRTPTALSCIGPLGRACTSGGGALDRPGVDRDGRRSSGARFIASTADDAVTITRNGGLARGVHGGGRRPRLRCGVGPAPPPLTSR